MFRGIIDDVKDGTGRAVKLGALAMASCLGLLVTISFLSAAAFIYVMNLYGPMYACLAVAAIFFVLSALLGIVYLVSGRGKKPKQRPPEPAKSPLSAFADPMLLATGLQVVRAVGIKRLLPILAIGGVALGIIASRGLSQNDDADGDEPPAKD